ncbi:MAG: hypothetical protein KO173_07095 [Methanoregulaceae archaeon]|nr:hypothetical protein [Methanoregulaceae archaeon]HRX33674.1 hypothetical protein [Methanoregulaceae archaeon]
MGTCTDTLPVRYTSVTQGIFGIHDEIQARTCYFLPDRLPDRDVVGDTIGGTTFIPVIYLRPKIII